MQHGCLCWLVLCRFKLGRKMPTGLKPGGNAVVPVWFQAALMWQGEDGKQGPCFSALGFWLCSMSAKATLEV